MATITTVDNFYLSNIEILTTPKQREEFMKSNSYYCLSNNKTIKESNVSLKEYQKKSPNNTFFSFFKDEEKRDSKNDDDLIISIKNDGDNYLAQTGNYV